jgi:plasmid stabilization system protein ParE
MKFRFHPEAENEFIEAVRYYASVHTKLAEDFVDEIEHGIAAIQRNPLAWRIVASDVRRYLVHRFPFGIYYTCGDDSVTIWAVMHLSRLPDYWKSRIR